MKMRGGSVPQYLLIFKTDLNLIFFIIFLSTNGENANETSKFHQKIFIKYSVVAGSIYTNTLQNKIRHSLLTSTALSINLKESC